MNEKGGLERVGKGFGTDQDGVGMCDGRILRFAETESDFGICSFGLVLSTLP